MGQARARVGSVVDKYAIVKVLGHGGMGAVYEARHVELERRFAIKFLLARHAENPDVLRRFKNEAKAAGRLEHPNLAAVTDFGSAADGAPYIVMEFLQGKDCAQLLRSVGPLPVWRAVNLLMQTCRGLAVAHKAGIVHRDLKPENLFVTDAGDGRDLIKVLDFGIAKLQAVDVTVVTGTGQMFGTPHYMSPEQARGLLEVDERTDVWALGVVLYEMLGGRKPFQGQQALDLIYQIQTFDPPPLAGFKPDLPPGLVTVVERAMAKDLSRRIPSVLALAEALLPWAGATDPGNSSDRWPLDVRGRTVVTPATVIGGATDEKVWDGPADSNLTATVVPKRRTKRFLIGVAFLLVGIVAIAATRRAWRRSSSPASGAVALPRVLTNTTAGLPSAAPAGTPPTKGVSAPADTPAKTTLAGDPKVSSAPAPAPVVRPPSADGIRTVFEGVSKRSNKRTTRSAAEPKDEVMAPAVAPSRPNPATPLPTPATGRPIYIDEADPFAP